MDQLRAELRSSKNRRNNLKQEVTTLSSNLHVSRRALIDQAAALLEKELKVEGPKAMTTYKASRGFKSSLENMGCISYEFRYCMTLKRYRAKHPEAEVEVDPFAECPEDGNVTMDLCQPFDDSTPTEK
ncbi:hypothetical protein B296_00029839 [Ensete ventricosum]|uniref:Uncharacterized protein n=1 Tax=Ensete ventricosum TaxID=4639 RepID=A0A426YWV0_ENSVE|nr:hypothetical protein B296_00029839 [Ensete ventricosum]